MSSIAEAVVSIGPGGLSWFAGHSAGWIRSRCLVLVDGFCFPKGSVASCSDVVEFPLALVLVGSFWEPVDEIPHTTRGPP